MQSSMDETETILNDLPQTQQACKTFCKVLGWLRFCTDLLCFTRFCKVLLQFLYDWDEIKSMSNSSFWWFCFTRRASCCLVRCTRSWSLLTSPEPPSLPSISWYQTNFETEWWISSGEGGGKEGLWILWKWQLASCEDICAPSCLPGQRTRSEGFPGSGGTSLPKQTKRKTWAQD